MLTLVTAIPIPGSATDSTIEHHIQAHALERGERPDDFDWTPALNTGAALMYALDCQAIFVADHDTYLTRPVEEHA